MGVYINIPAATKEYLKQLVRDEHELFAQDCTIVYTPKMIPCTTCSASPIGAGPGSFWNDGVGLNNFESCPGCNGIGQIAEETSEVISLMMDWKTKPWSAVPVNINVPYGSVNITGDMADLPKVKKANIFRINKAGYDFEFQLFGEAVDGNGFFKDMFFRAVLVRI